MDQSSFIRRNVENDKNTKQPPLQLLCKINSGRWSSMQKVRFRYHIPQLWAILTIETSCVQSLDSNNRNKLHATKSLVFSSLVRISTPTSWALTLLLSSFSADWSKDTTTLFPNRQKRGNPCDVSSQCICLSRSLAKTETKNTINYNTANYPRKYHWGRGVFLPLLGSGSCFDQISPLVEAKCTSTKILPRLLKQGKPSSNKLTMYITPQMFWIT
jgi:hypothetical protein